MIPAEQQPLQILVQFVAPGALSHRLDVDFFGVSLDVFPKKLIGVRYRVVDFAHVHPQWLCEGCHNGCPKCPAEWIR